MAASLRPYDRMKDSGVEWLGEVPAHWDVRRLGQIGTLLKGRGGSKEDEVEDGIPCVRYGDLYTTHTWAITETRSRLAPTKAGEYTSIRFGDVLFAASGETTDEIGKSAVNLIHSRACCGGDIILFRARLQLDPRFMGYAADCRASAAQKASMGRGFTVVHIYPHQIKRIALALPPLPEQSAIARFLDHITSRIDRYIRAKEKLVELLEEQKQVIVHEAVTGRIDVRTGNPYPAYKPSGADWLGDVPAHWEVSRLKSLMANVVDQNHSRVEEGVFLALEHVESWTGMLKDSGKAFTSEGQFKSFQAGDILFGKLRPYLAKVTRPETAGRCVGEFLVLRPRHKKYESGYAEYFLRSKLVIDTINSSTCGARMPRAEWAFIGSLHVVCPPALEQNAISRSLAEALANADRAIDRTHRELDLLQEYRTRLIADVVTGKLDVREAAFELPSPNPGSNGTENETIAVESNPRLPDNSLGKEANP